MEKIKCPHEGCKGCLGFLYKGEVLIACSSEVQEEHTADSDLYIEKKCTSCKKKVVIITK